mmetsp:Transcript_32780/g.53178  ORF Transcript_32780/g.53178 Transcript_32780/m.53178 type:complete len:655 (+) Transcript_32780:51-2015(+)
MASRWPVRISILFALFSLCCAFYLPGVAPREYKDGEDVDVKVNSLTSSKTQLPFSFYSLPLRGCQPKDIVDSPENLGEVLRGDKIQNSLYKFQMNVPKTCVSLCRAKQSKENLELFKSRIDEEYWANMIVDNLPVALRVPPNPSIDSKSDTTQQKHVPEPGYPIGVVAGGPSKLRLPAEMKQGKHYLYNHLKFIVFYHEEPSSYQGKRIVGFEVEPFSRKYSGKIQEGIDQPIECADTTTLKLPPLALELEAAEKNEKIIFFTYDVAWQPSDLKWASRWDVYLHMTDNQIHWFSIINSLMIVLFLTGMVAMILMRTLHQDFRRYNQLETQEDAQEETGWKLVHGDVFRPPNNAMLLSVLVGTGCQVFGMSLITLLFAVLGFLSPANRGGLMTAMVLLFVFMGVLSGYYSSRMYKMFKGTAWKKNTLLTAILFPGVVFSIFLLLNLLIAGKSSAGAVPFWTLFALVFLWFGISVPLVFIGSYFGLKKAAIEHPVRTNQIPRQIPEQPWYMKPVLSVLIGGILPFGAVFIELFFILSSIWLHQFYYMFGFLFLVFIILILTCAEITIVLCYFQLCGEDYNWWWRAFLTAGSSALYLFAYSVFYFFTRLSIKEVVPAVLFFGYTAIISFSFFLLTGSIGFWACFLFVTMIYGSVKVD